MDTSENNQQLPGQIYVEISGLAVASFVLGLLFLLFIGPVLSAVFSETNDLTFVLSALPILLCIGSPAALVLGLMARRKIKNSNGRLAGSRLATAGIILGSFFWVPWLAAVGCSQKPQVRKSARLTFPPLEDRLGQIQAEKNHLPDKYAVIINGDGSKQHIGNVSLAYNALKQNDFVDENIFVLSYQKTVEDAQIAVFAPTFGNLQMVFRFLSDRVDDKDLLFIYGTGHGVRKGDVSEISIRRLCRGCKRPHLVSGVSEIEFEYLIKEIHPEYALLVFDQCEAGGFGTKLQSRQEFVVICRAAQHERGKCGYFTKALFDAFGDDSSDADNDGRISVAEAFSKTLQTVGEIDAGYKDDRYTPSIKGGLDPNTIYLDGNEGL